MNGRKDDGVVNLAIAGLLRYSGLSDVHVVFTPDQPHSLNIKNFTLPSFILFTSLSKDEVGLKCICGAGVF